jgi:hypothetical protein
MLFDSNKLFIGGGDRTRTCYLLLAKQPLYQVSYTPNNFFRLLRKSPDSIESNGGSGWTRTNDPCLIKAVL